jgi:release factor glutamine methyltransferase
LYENIAALDGGTDGLSVLRRVSASAIEWLAPGGHLLVETSEQQALSAAEIFLGNGLTASTLVSDEYSATVVTGARPPEGRRGE